MKTRAVRLDELARARELQDEAARLHIPMPVLSWRFEVKNKDGNTIEKGVGKANSFTRNALNLLAWHVGLAAYEAISSSNFGDGIISVKAFSGSVISFASYASRYQAGTGSYGPKILLGTGSVETLDDYAVTSENVINPSMSSSFNATTRKLISTIAGAYQNNSGSPIDITESGIRVYQGTNISYSILTIHDIFDAITVPNGGVLVWTYVTEVAYPNP